MKLHFLKSLGILCLTLLHVNYFYAQQDAPPPQSSDMAYIEAMERYNTVVHEQRFTNVIADTNASLPLGLHRTVGGSTFIIAIDSGRFLPGSANCSAYMALSLPGMKDTMAFAAKNIVVNPKGVMSGGGTVAYSKLMLVSKHRLKMGPKVTMVLANDGNNYIEWDCNGFQAIKLKGHFEIGNGVLVSDIPGDSIVKASFEIYANTIEDIIINTSITPFHLKQVEDISFSITNAVADFSSVANTPMMQFPPGYVFDPEEQSNPFKWKGFYLKNITVTLPPEISPKNGGRTTIQANNMLIDNTGLTGNFSATNILEWGDSKMDSWAFSVNQLGITVLQNHITGGSISGSINVPLFKDEQNQYNSSPPGFAFSTIITENAQTKELDYQFSVSPKNNMKFEVMSAKVDVFNTSVFTVTKINKTFTPSMVLNGEIAFGDKNLSTGKLAFQNVHIVTTTPYVTQGTFNYVASTQNKSMNYPITINSMGLGFNNNNNTVAVYVNVGLNFMAAGSQGFSANTGLTLKTKYTPNPSDALKPKLEFDKVVLSDINLNVATVSFSISGTIVHTDGDPVYGNSWGGALSFKIDEPSVTGNFEGRFGAKTGFKYFYVAGDVTFPAGIPITATTRIMGFLGGVSYNMDRATNYVQAMQTTPPTLSNFVPDSTKGLGIRAGATLVYTEERVLNGDITFSILFNNPQHGGGICSMSLQGDVFCMSTIAERKGKRYNQVPIGGTAIIGYDFNNDVLQGIANVYVNYQGVNAQINSGMRFSAGAWYVYLGKPTAKAYVNTPSMNYNGYFMAGNDLEGASFPGGTGNIDGGRDSTALSNGTSFCVGLEGTQMKYDEKMVGGKNVSVGVYYSAYFTVGFELMLTRYNNGFLCPNTGSPPGINRYYCKGNIYGAMGGSIGARFRIFDTDYDKTILTLAGSLSLGGEFVKPTYVEGNLSGSFDFLGGVVEGSFSFNFEYGTRCE
jgi:hypothetical protein